MKEMLMPWRLCGTIWVAASGEANPVLVLVLEMAIAPIGAAAATAAHISAASARGNDK